MGGKLLNTVKSLYRDAYMRVKRELGDSFEMHARVEQGCVVPTGLFTLFINGVIGAMKATFGNSGVDLHADDNKQGPIHCYLQIMQC